MKTVEVTLLEKEAGHISQVYSQGLQYSLLNDKYEQCHHFVYCKDFIQDAIHGFLNNKKATIFGFTYDPSKMPKLSLDRCRILVVNDKDKDFANKVENSLDLLNQVEKDLKLKLTEVEKVSNKDKIFKNGGFIFSGSGMWNNSPTMVSLYSLLIRVGFAHVSGKPFMDTLKGISEGKIKQYQSSDREQITSALPGIKKILDKGYRKFFYIESSKNYPGNVSTGLMHSDSGIVAFASGNTRNVCKYWTRKSIDNPKPVVPAEPAK